MGSTNRIGMKKLQLTLILAGTLLFASQSRALDFDYSGTFSNDNDIVSVFFTVGATSNVTIFSSSWDDGGFDPILAIWHDDQDGFMVQQQDDGFNTGSTLSNGSSYTHGAWDSYFTVELAAGNYRATIAQYNNFASRARFADGFNFDSVANFTNPSFGNQSSFNGAYSENDPRNGNWAFHILNVATSVPDPSSTLGLMVMGFGAILAAQRRTRRNG
jgi:hypothetical protein